MAAGSTTSTTVKRAAPLPPEQRRAAIIDAALPLLLEFGSAVTTRQLATAAGVSEGTIFNVFEDKDSLLAAAVETALDQEPFERSVSELDASKPFERRLTEATELIQRRIVDHWRLMSRLDHHHHLNGHRRLPDSPALAALLAAERHQLRTTPVESARLLRALTLALTHPWLAAEPRDAADIVDVFLNGNRVSSPGQGQ